MILSNLLFFAAADGGTVSAQGAAEVFWAQAFDLVGAILIFAGVSFTVIAAIGLIRFSDLFARTHAAAKPQLLGLMLLLTGLAFFMRSLQWVLLCVVVLAIQMIAAPVASHLLGRAAYRTGIGQTENLVINDLADIEY